MDRTENIILDSKVRGVNLAIEEIKTMRESYFRQILKGEPLNLVERRELNALDKTIDKLYQLKKEMLRGNV